MKLHFILFCAIAGLSCAHRGGAPAGRTAPAPQPVIKRQILNAVDAGDGDYLIGALRAKMAANPEDLQVRLELAKTYQERGYPELALEHYRLAAAHFPESAEVELLLVKSLREFGMQAEAVRTLDLFLKAHPQKTPKLEAWLGILYDEAGQWPEGEAAHRAALALAPKLDYLHNNLGYNLLKQGKNDAAAGEFREALRLNPKSVVARNNLGLALADKPEQAIVNWQSVSDPATAHNNMAALLIEEGRYAEARKELNLALGYNRAHSAALSNLRLVSQLDGKPATVEIQPPPVRRSALKAALHWIFVGPEKDREPKTPGKVIN